MVRSIFLLMGALLTFVPLPLAAHGQDTATAAKPTEHVVGSVVAVDAAAQTVTVKEDGSGVQHLVQLQSTRTLLKVSPGAKDLKAAVRISASDLAAGDRVDIRGSKVESDAGTIAARSVVLMSSRELQQAHQNEASAWQRSTGGIVTAIDPASKKLTITVKTVEGAKPVVVDTSSAVFTRFAPEHPKSAVPSQLGEIQSGDQVRIIGEHSEDGGSLTAQKIYSGTFKTIAGTVSSIAPDGKSLVVKDLATKQPMTVSLSDDSGMHKLPPAMAMMLARRFNPDLKNAAPAGAAGAPPVGAAQGTGAASASHGAKPADATAGPGQPSGDTGGPAAGPGSAAPRGRMGGSDLSLMLDRLPKITTADLKNGDAVIVSGSPSAASRATLLATSVVAGVEPIFQAAPGRQAQSLGDWGSSLGAGAAMDAGSPPQ